MNPDDRPHEESPAPKDMGTLPEDLRLFEAQMKSLTPQPGRLNRDRLIFLAGQASVEGEGRVTENSKTTAWAWPAAFTVSTAVAASLLFLLLTQPRESPAPKIFVDRRPTVVATRQTSASSPDSQPPLSQILTSAPSQLHRVDEFLATGYQDAKNSDSIPGSSPAVYWEEGKRLTPTSIHFLMNDATKTAPSDQDSSSFTSENGANA